MMLALALACTVVDGDTLRCGSERIRLQSVDSCELRGKQRLPGCTIEKARAATEALRVLIAQGPLTIQRVNKDRFGRTVAVLHVNGTNVNCALVAAGYAVYHPEYGRVCG